MMISTNLADLNAVLPLYRELSGKSDYDILSKQGGKLGFAIYQALQATVPAKGSIRSHLTGRLAAGLAVRIRPSVIESVAAKVAASKAAGKYAKRGPNIKQLRVKREIGIRESGRGVLAYSIRYPKTITGSEKAISKYGTLMSQAGIKIPPSNMAGASKYMRFTWSGISKISSRVARGLQAPRGASAISTAIKAVKEDIMKYVTRKQLEIAERAMKAAVRS